MSDKKRISLEKEALDLSVATENPPFIYQMSVDDARQTLETLQQSPVDKMPVDIENRQIDTGEYGSINMRIYRPQNSNDVLPVLFFVHGAGWVLGSADTHDKLIRELAVRTNSVVFAPEYTRSPEAKYPVALEQSYAALELVAANADGEKWDPSRITIAGDSVGGNMATVLTIMAKDRKGPKIQRQVLYYPVTNHAFDTGSYDQFADGYWLLRDSMKWFWDQYLPEGQDSTIKTISPLQATKEDLQGLPAAMILNGQADVLRDEGEAYAVHLREAGVDVTQMRFQGMVHDFVMINSLDQTKAARAAMDVSVDWINKGNKLSK